MTQEQKADEVSLPYDYLTTSINGITLSHAYRKGKQAGIREVVGLVNLYIELPELIGTAFKRIWQAKLKEWV